MRRVLVAGIVSWTLAGCTGAPKDGDAYPVDAVERGRALYREHGCSICHGAAGQGDGVLARSLTPPPRDLRRATDFRVARTVAAVADFIGHGAAAGSTAMPRYAHLDDSARRDLAAFVLALGSVPPHDPLRR